MAKSDKQLSKEYLYLFEGLKKRSETKSTAYTTFSIETSDGICYNIYKNYLHFSHSSGNTAYQYDIKLIIRHACLKYDWPHYSGDDLYPISAAGIVKYKSERDAFNLSDNLWDRRTEYGKRRYELLDLCIKFLKEHK